jgi:hypothetical protein
MTERSVNGWNKCGTGLETFPIGGVDNSERYETQAGGLKKSTPPDFSAVILAANIFIAVIICFCLNSFCEIRFPAFF